VLKEISQLIEVNAFEESDGSLVVLTADGRPLVEASSSWELVISSDERGFETINWQDRDGNLYDITDRLRGGKLGGWVVARDHYIEGYKEDLNTFVAALIEEVNTLHASGYGITVDPTTGKPYTGIDFFLGSNPFDIEVNPELKKDPFKIATAEDVNGVPGDNRIALAISRLRYKTVLSNNNSTFDSFYQGLVSKVGSDVKQSQSFYEHQQDMLSYLSGFRESVSGVSIDEEMMNLLIQQRAYQASAKVISTVDELMDTLLRM
ncbi:MAG: flagellar hook-associated protein FlgK, partial [Desulfatiglandales bacterium]